jgi:hypothetical protein
MSEGADTRLSGVVTPAPDSNLRGRLPWGSRARTLDAGVRRHDGNNPLPLFTDAGMTETTHYHCLLKGYIGQDNCLD